MKKCAHCGREADEQAAACEGCGRNEFVPSESAAAITAKGWRWAGLVFSVLVPGFGLAHKGRFGLAVAWFLGIELGLALVALVFAMGSIPFWLGVTTGAFWVTALLVMLYQSYGPGRMTRLHWAAFAGILALTAVVPSPAELIARPFKIPSNSMRPTLRGGSNHVDHLIVDRLTYRFSPPRRGDVVVFRTDGIPDVPEGQFWVKRLVGMPGERLEIHGGFIYANGAQLTTNEGIPQIHFVTREAIERGDKAIAASYDVPKSGYFVLGDNSANSLDSRYFGCVPQENVYGKVTGIYYPFSRAGRLHQTSEPSRAGNRGQPVGPETNQTSVAAGAGQEP